MDREQEEMQFIGFFGIFKESFRIISTWRKIFTQITLSLLLPLAFIFLAEMKISDIFFSYIIAYVIQEVSDSPTDTHLTKFVWVYFFLFKFVYFTFLLILSLFSTAAVVYTIAGIYTGRDITFKKVISVVPRIWKRLMVTFLCMFLAFFIYNIVAVALIWAATVTGNLATILIFVILFLYALGFIYMAIVWQLACVVSVLETLHGFKAMTKAMKLIKGQRFIVIAILLLLDVTFVGIELGFEILGMYEVLDLAMWKKIGYGILFFLILTMLFLFGLVIQTVLYLVCKSYHHENIDKPSLADRLDSYFGDYERLVSREVQLQQQSSSV